MMAHFLGPFQGVWIATFTVGKDLQSGKLQAVLSEYISVERYIYACYFPSRYLPAKIRAFIDFFCATYRRRSLLGSQCLNRLFVRPECEIQSGQARTK